MAVDEWKEISHKVKSITDDNETVYDACWIKSSPVSIYLPDFLSVCLYIFLSLICLSKSLSDDNETVYDAC